MTSDANVLSSTAVAAPFRLRIHQAVFDSDAFDEMLATSDEPLAVFRQTLKQGTELLHQQFLQEAPIAELISARAVLVDQLLIRAWQLHHLPEDKVALVAVGGYGRGELHPFSDIDFLVLLEGQQQLQQEFQDRLSEFLLFCWNLGLEIGHSVRTLDDCVEQSQDITVITNLLEARLLIGSSAVFEQMRQMIAPDQIWPNPDFLAAKYHEQQQRHHKFGDTAYRLEPNVKEAPGGLRDIQMIGWVVKRHFGAETMHDLVVHQFLTEGEYRSLMEGQDFLWKIRFALHHLNNRREDRLLFDYQLALAKQFGFVDQEHDLAVEQFMHQYYQTVMELARLNEMLLQHFEEAILLHDQLEAPIHLNKRFQVRNGFVEVAHPQVFEYNPEALLEIFLLLQLHPELKGVRASTIRLIREHRDLIDAHFRHALGTRSLFMEILRQPQGITHALRRMNRYGILARYVPSFAHIVGRMQYDLFHVYTVDEHTLFVVRNLRRFLIPKHSQEFPLCSRIIKTLPKLELLYLAALFHDIGKGKGGDHSTIGAKEALQFCQLHQLSNLDSRLVAWLVEKHLLMSMTAQRRDISDPDVVQDFASQISDPVRLDYLYLLTVADARATNPDRWNAWRDALLRQLYHATRRVLLRGLDKPQHQDEMIRDKQKEAKHLLERTQSTVAAQVNTLWEQLGDDYFLHHLPSEIARHARLILQHQANRTGQGVPLIHLESQSERGGTELLIYCQERNDHLFARITKLLDQLGLNVVDAHIMTTTDHFNLNSFQVLNDDGQPVDDSYRKQEILHVLQQWLEPEASETSDLTVSRHIPRHLKHFPTSTHVEFYPEPHRQRTVMKLVAWDRPGLLARVGQVFSYCDVQLHKAKITTIGAETEDIFFITNQDNQPITDSAQLEDIATELKNVLDESS